MKALFSGTYDKIEDMALLVRDKVSSKLDPPAVSVRDCLRRTVEAFGGTVDTIQDPSDPLRGGGSLVIYGQDNFVIWVSPYQSPLRANFTIAHELGHYLLHYKHNQKHEGEPVVFNRFGSDEYEWQANRFAAAFLMPKDEFKKYHEKYNGNLVLLAGHFGVSESAVEVRGKYVLG
jgi:Zn-dependent peptidase ImmA (M78 family)